MTATVDERAQTTVTSGAPPLATSKAVVVLAISDPGERLLERLARRDPGERPEVLIVAPAIASRIGFWTDEERWHSRAAKIVRDATAMLTAAGFSTRGWVGDANPLDALADVLQTERVADVIVVGTASDSKSRLERQLLAPARIAFKVPVAMLETSTDQTYPWRLSPSRGGRIAAVAVVGLVLALVLSLVGAGNAWLAGELGIVLGLVLLDVAAHLALVAGLWFGAGPAAKRYEDAYRASTTPR